jgi:hypothetical protein
MSRGIMRRTVAAICAMAALGATAIPASANAVTVGETFTPDHLCDPGFTWLQVGSPNDQYIVPFPGQITSWSHRASALPPDLELKVGRFVGGDDYAIVGESGLESPTPNTLNTFPVDIRVEAGDVLGFYTGTSGYCGRFDSDFAYVYAAGDVPRGDTETFTLVAGPSGFQLDVSAEVRPFRCGGKNATIAGTEGSDTLEGTNRRDVIAALGGKDTVRSFRGNDVVCGAGGKDKLKGGGGKDKLRGQKGGDRLKGGGGKDKLKGAKGKDKLNGGGGKDKCVGGKGDDSAKKCEVEKSL